MLLWVLLWVLYRICCCGYCTEYVGVGIVVWVLWCGYCGEYCGVLYGYVPGTLTLGSLTLCLYTVEYCVEVTPRRTHIRKYM